MKIHSHNNPIYRATAFFVTVVCLANSARAQDVPVAAVTAKKIIPQSVFTIPKNASEGRDPFYPNSPRPYGNTGVIQISAAPAASLLVLNGLSGAVGHRLAMINGRTIAEGESAEIPTPAGSVKVLCIEIKARSVFVEVAGARQELSMRDGK